MKNSRLPRVFLQTIFVACLLTSSIPRVTSAAVIISELFYDAPGSDTGKEWVEVFNTGPDAVDMTGWKINDGSNHVLNVPPKNGGVGNILLPSGGYAIIADNAAEFLLSNPQVATVYDTVLAISNTSATVSLVNPDGATVDALTFTKDAGGAGDGYALYRLSASTIGLGSALPTPGTGTLVAHTSGAGGSQSTTTNTSSSPSTTAPQQTTQTSTTTSSGVVSSYVAPPLQKLFVDAGDDREVIVGADTVFKARAYNREREIVDGVRFAWNFGDGTRSEGQSVVHHFEYPGTHIVVATISEQSDSITDSFKVKATPAQLYFSLFPDGSLGIRNDAGRELDLSNWLVYQSWDKFMLPEMTYLLPGETLRLSSKRLGFTPNQYAELLYPNGMRAFVVGQVNEVKVEMPVAATAPLSVVAPTQRFAAAAPIAREYRTQAGHPVIEEKESGDATTTTVAETLVEPEDAKRAWWWAAVVVALLAGVGVYAYQRIRESEEWEIVE